MSFRIQTLLLVIGSCESASAQAQVYRCVVNGTTYISDRPCATPNPSPSKLIAVDPTRAPTVSRPPTLQPAPDHQRFLSQRCAEVSDAIRTAPSRGVGYSTIQDLQREYQRNCSEDEAFARQRAADERSREREKQSAVRQESERSQRDATRRQERCAALRDTLRTRRDQADKALTQATEDAYNTHCLGR